MSDHYDVTLSSGGDLNIGKDNNKPVPLKRIQQVLLVE